jgi:hypothetical protein
VQGWELALYGLFGGFAITAWDLAKVIHAKGRWPWRVRGAPAALPYWTAELIRVALGGGVAWTAAASGQLTTPIAAVAIGTAAPLILERMSRRDTDRPHGQIAAEPEPTHAPGPRSAGDEPLRSPAGDGSADAG